VAIDEFADETATSGATTVPAGAPAYVERFESLGEQDLAAATEVFLDTLGSAAAGGGDDVDDAAMTWGVAVADSLRACGFPDD